MFDSVRMKNRISEIRKARGLTLVEVAKRANTSNQQISHLERGRRKLSYEWMERLATALSCHPLDLLPDRPTDVRSTMSRLSPKEQGLLELFRTLDAQEQDTLLLAIRPMVAFVTGVNPA
ncbi:helix-turn-helix domain-containing protein [Pseudogemmobacter bohemicus]|uniref:helix-turn-helix domain-containing protein n=1 Tax=Pseudogemmobacter bohemicus TaxID=2250708 RepID=UPI000DD2CA08|nr:helix-turn-helix domain-containing protein [Pseudogemmobacter bohemicus]